MNYKGTILEKHLKFCLMQFNEQVMLNLKRTKIKKGSRESSVVKTQG